MVVYTLEQRWEILRHIDFGKEIIFSDEAHIDLARCVNKQNCRIWCTENPQSRRTQNELLCGADFGPEA